MGRPIEIKPQVQEKNKNMAQNDASSTHSHDLQNPRALLKLSTPILYTNNTQKEKLNPCFSYCY